MFCFLECIGHVRELTGILFHLLYSSSSFCCKQTSHCDPVRRELLYQQGFQILPCLAVDLLFLTDLKFFNISICMWILYISGIWISFPSEMWNREHTSITWSICRTQAFNLYYFRNWIPSLTLVQLSGKPRSLGLGALGGVWLLEESVHALDSLRSCPLLSSPSTERPSSRSRPQHFFRLSLKWLAVPWDVLPQDQPVKQIITLNRDVLQSLTPRHTLLLLTTLYLLWVPHQQSGYSQLHGTMEDLDEHQPFRITESVRLERISEIVESNLWLHTTLSAMVGHQGPHPVFP